MSQSSTIMLCDHVNSTRNKLKGALEADGYQVIISTKSEDLLTTLHTSNSSIIIFNCHSNNDCMNDIYHFFTYNDTVPLIVLSDYNDPKLRFSALEVGVFEFISGPYLVQEILIHIKRALKLLVNGSNNYQKRDDVFYEFGDFIWSSLARELRTKKGFLINLTETEAAILDFFIQNPEKELSRDEIWYWLRKRERWPLDRTLDGHIARLRSKIQDSSNNDNCFIKSVRGKGYVFKPFAFFKSFDERNAYKSRPIANEISL